MPAVMVNGQSVYFRGGAVGPYPLLLVHGAAHHGAKWDRILSRIANAVAPDLPGHGHSEGEGMAEVSAYAAWLLAFADAMGLDRPIAVGHSLGGAVCLSAVLESDRWSGLGLIATGAKLRVAPEWLQALRSGQVPKDMPPLMFGPRAISGQVRQEEWALSRCDPAVRAADFVACDAFDARDRLSEVRVPTEVVVGTEDRMTPQRYSEFLVRGIAGASLTPVPDAGHLVMVERPDDVTQSLTRLIRRARGDRPSLR